MVVSICSFVQYYYLIFVSDSALYGLSYIRKPGHSHSVSQYKDSTG
jgi:hypothetical protein